MKASVFWTFSQGR